MPSQTNEATDEVIEIEKGRFTSKAWKYFKPVKINGVRVSFCKYCRAHIKLAKICWTSM